MSTWIITKKTIFPPLKMTTTSILNLNLSSRTETFFRTIQVKDSSIHYVDDVTARKKLIVVSCDLSKGLLINMGHIQEGDQDGEFPLTSPQTNFDHPHLCWSTVKGRPITKNMEDLALRVGVSSDSLIPGKMTRQYVPVRSKALHP